MIKWLSGDKALKALKKHKVIGFDKHGAPQLPNGRKVSLNTIREWVNNGTIKSTRTGWRIIEGDPK